jgi:hypothetical protein
MSAPPLTKDTLMQTIMGNCEKDDVSGVAECLDFASSSGSKAWVQRLLPRCMSHAAIYGSTEVISYLVTQGADVTRIPGGLRSATGTPPTRETLEVLFANGWNINNCLRGRDEPVLWSLVEDIHLVEWCLDHGASVGSTRRYPSRVYRTKTHP